MFYIDLLQKEKKKPFEERFFSSPLHPSSFSKPFRVKTFNSYFQFEYQKQGDSEISHRLLYNLFFKYKSEKQLSQAACPEFNVSGSGVSTDCIFQIFGIDFTAMSVNIKDIEIAFMAAFEISGIHVS